MHRSGLDLVLLNIIITDLEEGISSTLIKFEEDLKQRSCQYQNWKKQHIKRKEKNSGEKKAEHISKGNDTEERLGEEEEVQPCFTPITPEAPCFSLPFSTKPKQPPGRTGFGTSS